MGSVELSGIKMKYGTQTVLHDISFEAEDGEFVVLVGPSGCGKSTSLRILAGLEEATEGDISIDGKRVNGMSPKDRDIAMVFQNYALYPHMTVGENMAFSLRLAGASTGEKEEKVRRAADILNLSELLDRFPRQLSGGQKQRVAMGRAIVRNPKVFLFDEPLSNLDAKLRVLMREEIKELHHRLGATIVYVTHDQIEAMTLADRIVIMRDGYIEQIGAPLELFDRPKNTFVAGFIGSPMMNFLEGTIGSNKCVLLNGEEIEIGDIPGIETGQRVVVGVRPDDIGVGDTGISARVVLTENTGSELYIVAKMDGKRISLSLRDRMNLNAGDELNLIFPEERLHIFDAESGNRLNAATKRV